MIKVLAILAAEVISLAFFALFFVVALLFTGCSGKEIVEVKMPVPLVCEYNLTKQPIIRSSTNVELLETLTNLAYDGRMLRDDIRSIPCLDIKEVQ